MKRSGAMSHLQHCERGGLCGRRLLELGEPVPSLAGVSADLAEESPHVPVNQITVGEQMAVWRRGQAQAAERV